MTMAKRAEALIARQGITVTYKRYSGETATTSIKKTPTYTDAICRAFLTDQIPKNLAGTVEEGERRIYIAARAISFIPTVKDKVVAQGKVYAILDVSNLASHGESAVYMLKAKGV